MDFCVGGISELEMHFGHMFIAHASEVGVLGASRFLPQAKTYRAIEAQGGLRVYLAYDDGQPAGYQIFLLVNHPHYAGVRWAQADAVYVRPENRGIGAVRFIVWADAQLGVEGVDVIQRGASTANTYGRLLEYLEYSATEVQYHKKVR